MNQSSKSAKDKSLLLAGALYVISAILAVVFVYMVIVNVIYIKNYLASYAMTFSDMWMDASQYIITGSVSYFVYALLLFSAGRIISMLSRNAAIVKTGQTEAQGEEADASAIETLEREAEKNTALKEQSIAGPEEEPVQDEAVDGEDEQKDQESEKAAGADLIRETETEQAERTQQDDVLAKENLDGAAEPAEQAEKDAGKEAAASESDIPESEDAIEKTEVIEEGEPEEVIEKDLPKPKAEAGAQHSSANKKKSGNTKKRATKKASKKKKK